MGVQCATTSTFVFKRPAKLKSLSRSARKPAKTGNSEVNAAKRRRRLDAGIDIHAQVVLCPGINDGEILQRTIADLAAEYPRISSVAIVPLGLTRYNTDARLTAVAPDFCRQVIAEVALIQFDFRKKMGTTFAFLGDEIYLRAGRAVPGGSH